VSGAAGTTAGRERRPRRVVAVVAAAGVVAAVLSPPVSARLKAVAVGAEAIGYALPRPFAADVSRVETRLGGVTGDLYASSRPAPAIVLLPGATPAGRDDPRAVAVARAVARAGRTVFVPELTLYARSIDVEDVDRIATAATALAGHPLGLGPVVIVGFSYGGAYGLVAAADPRLSGRLALVATFGAYWDLLGVVQAATTGTSIVQETRIGWNADPQAGELLTEHAVQLAPAGHRDQLAAALAGQAEPAELDRDARALYDLLTNDDPERTPALAARLAPDARRTLRQLSPARTAHRVDAPLVAMHAVDDPAVPYAEALRLVRDRPDARLLTVELFTHVDFAPASLLAGAPDLWRTWRFAGWVLAAQERPVLAGRASRWGWSGPPGARRR